MRFLYQLPILACITPVTATRYNEYILAPKSRILHPTSLHSRNGTVADPDALLASARNLSSATTFENMSAAAYDFGINIAGIVSLEISNVSDNMQYIGVTFSESSLWVSNASSDATADAGKDETLWFHVTEPGRYISPREKERGAFRYMTLVHNGTGSIVISAAEVFYTPMPHWEDNAIGNYSGYFHCNGSARPS